MWNSVSHSKEERRLRMFENKVIRRFSGPKTEERARGWKQMYEE
jgi:hypothetical protein